MKLTTVIQRSVPALLVALALLAAPPDATSGTSDKKKNKSGKTEKTTSGSKIQRVPNNPFESIKNKVSNVEFFSTNYGIFGNDVARGAAGGWWPRGSNSAYIFGGGVWFGAKKNVTVSGVTQLKSLSVIGYNPNSGNSWMTPGRIQGDAENSPIDDSPEGISKYRLYFSSDYNNFTGEPLDAADKRAGGPNWPIWDTNPADTLKRSRYTGNYVDDLTQRNREIYTKGPAIISQEDIFSTYKDTDVDRFEGEEEAGLPFGIQVEQTIYSWGFGSDASPYRDFVFLKYVIINMSDDTLRDCYMAPAMDMDLGQAANDHTRFYSEGDSLNLAVQWSEGSSGDGSKYGYIGFDFLESPAIDTNITSPNFGFIRKDKRVYGTEEQVGLTTFQNWVIDEDPKSPAERYQFMSANEKDGDNGAGDKRFLMATGPFSMLPGDSARVVVGVLFARSNGGGIATGTEADLRRLVGVDTFAQQVYDKNFLAPVPPDAAFLSWRPLDNGVELHWDSTSEMSLDLVERGLDFAGYRIQRTRKASGKFAGNPNDSIQGWNIGWKTIGGFALPPIPDSATRLEAGRRRDLSLLGAWSILPQLADLGSPDSIGRYPVYRWDTLKRPDSADRIQRGELLGYRPIYSFTFDPYNDIDPNIRTIVRAAITQIMDSISNGRRFIDVGDDNNNGVVLENQTNLAQNEKLINNVDYYYRLLAYDAGSVEEGTPSKENSSVEGINEVRARPEAPAAGFPVTPTIISQDGLIGVRNPRFLVYDDERLGQLFGGDEITFEFQPVDPISIGYLNYYYANQIIVSSKNQGELMRYITPFDISGSARFSDRQEVLDTALRSGFRYFNFRDTLIERDTFYINPGPPPDTVTSYIITLKLKDSVFTSMKDRSVLYSGSFTPTPGTLTYFQETPIYKNTFGLAFDFTFRQFGDSLRFGRGDSLSRLAPFTVTAPGSNAILYPKRQFLGQFSSATTTYQSIPSIGQIKAEVEFVACNGCTETITFVKQNKTYTFPNVPYHTIKVRNVAGFTRDVIDETGGTSSQTTQYNYEFAPDPQADFKSDTARVSAPTLGRQIGLGQYGLIAYGFINPEKSTLDERRSATQRIKYVATNPVFPIGTANRYYYGQVTGTDSDGQTHTLRFNHKLLVNGAEVSIDFSGFVIEESNASTVRSLIPDQIPTEDFEAGDKFTVDFTGGTLGLPQPGAKVVVAIPQTKPEISQYTDDLLDQIRVVPNPFLISHVGMRANSERMLYFTRLPEECTIQIYTGTGELLQTINHKAVANDRVAVNAWELLTKGNRQVQSQLLVARITTPNGSETVKKFAVVVGGFRVVE